MRIIGHMVVRNEAGRYLERSLIHFLNWVDLCVVYDDQSDDKSVEICESLGALVSTRPDKTPSLLKHEGRFRQAAWKKMGFLANPEQGDVIVVLDADEFLLSSSGSPRETIEKIFTQSSEIDGLTVPVAEVFEVRDEVPMIRTDGFWGKISSCRVVRWKPSGVFAQLAMGSGSVPTNVHCINVEEPTILHYGYARPEDVREKYARYVGKSGHSASHVASIISKPRLTPWDGPLP